MYEYHYVVIWNNATTWVISGMVILPLGLTESEWGCMMMMNDDE